MPAKNRLFNFLAYNISLKIRQLSSFFKEISPSFVWRVNLLIILMN